MQTAPPCHCITSIRFTIFRLVEMIKKDTREKRELSRKISLLVLHNVMRNFILYFVLVLYIWCVCVNLLHKHKKKNASSSISGIRVQFHSPFASDVVVYSRHSLIFMFIRRLRFEERARWWLRVQIVEPERERSRCFNSKRFSTFRSCFPLFSVKLSCETTTTLLSVIDNRSKKCRTIQIMLKCGTKRDWNEMKKKMS